MLFPMAFRNKVPALNTLGIQIVITVPYPEDKNKKLLTAHILLPKTKYTVSHRMILSSVNTSVTFDIFTTSFAIFTATSFPVPFKTPL